MKTIYAILLSFCVLGFTSCVEVNAGSLSASITSRYSIKRVHYDPIMGMNIYKVYTPTGTYEVLWESEKGGLCVLK